MWVVIPVKRFSNAKSRLGPLLSEAERESLAQAMLHDVLSAVSSARGVSGIVVVSHEVRARYAVERVGGLFLEESGDGLNAAVRQAAGWLATHGRREMFVLPGDVPLVTAREVDDLVQRHCGLPAVTLTPDRERDGTNALLLSPLDVITCTFGRGSFAAHLAAAREVGVEPGVVTLAGLALDIDHPLDLRALLTFEDDSESLAYLMDSGIAERLLPHGSRARGGGANWPF